MPEQTQQQPESTFRAYVWCPMNNGKMLIEFNRGDTIKDLLRIVRQNWGIKLPTTETPRGRMSAGWNVLGQAEEGIYVPIHVDDPIPCSPEELSNWINRAGQHEQKDRMMEQRNHERWIISHGMYVDIGTLDEYTDRRNVLKGMVPADTLEWPRVKDSANIRLCIVVAIVGG